MIPEATVEAALEFRRDNTERLGMLRGQKIYLEHKIKIVKSQRFLSVDGTVAEREAMALASPEYVEVVEEYRDCVTELDTLLTRMKSGEINIEVWRTQAANQRRGNI